MYIRFCGLNMLNTKYRDVRAGNITGLTFNMTVVVNVKLAGVNRSCDTTLILHWRVAPIKH